MLALFDNDQTLGSVRTVVIAGSGRDNTLVYSSEAWFRERIDAALTANGIGFSAVRASKTVGGTVVFEIEVSVLDVHSNDDARRMVQTALQNAVYWYSPQAICSVAGPLGAAACQEQARFVFTNVQTRVLAGDDRTIPAAQSPYQLPAASGNAQVSLRSGSTDYVSDYVSGLGLGTPIGLALAAVGIIVLVKVLK